MHGAHVTKKRTSKLFSLALLSYLTHFGENPFMMTWNTLMAASALLIVPPMLLYLLGSKYLVDGIKTTGMKG